MSKAIEVLHALIKMPDLASREVGLTLWIRHWTSKCEGFSVTDASSLQAADDPKVLLAHVVDANKMALGQKVVEEASVEMEHKPNGDIQHRFWIDVLLPEPRQ